MLVAELGGGAITLSSLALMLSFKLVDELGMLAFMLSLVDGLGMFGRAAIELSTFITILATPIALHFTPLTNEVSAGQSFELD